MDVTELTIGRIVHWSNRTGHGVTVIRAVTAKRVYCSNVDGLTVVYPRPLDRFLRECSVEASPCEFGCGDTHSIGSTIEVPVFEVSSQKRYLKLTEEQLREVNHLKRLYDATKYSGNSYWSEKEKEAKLEQIREDILDAMIDSIRTKDLNRHKVFPSFSVGDTVQIMPDSRIIEDF